VVGDQHPDATLLEEADDALDVQHSDRIDAGEGFVQQDEARPGGQGPRDFAAPPLAAGQLDRRRIGQVGD
jgi:hypothetical protein